MAVFKKGDAAQVLDKEDGLYWDAVVKEVDPEQGSATVWIPLCKLKMTYQLCDLRMPAEERPIQRDSPFKRSELRLLVRKRKVSYKDGDKAITSQVKVNDPFEAFFELANGEEVAYERIIEIKEQTDDEEEENGKGLKLRKHLFQKNPLIGKRKNERKSTVDRDQTSAKNRKLGKSNLEEANESNSENKPSLSPKKPAEMDKTSCEEIQEQHVETVEDRVCHSPRDEVQAGPAKTMDSSENGKDQDDVFRCTFTPQSDLQTLPLPLFTANVTSSLPAVFQSQSKDTLLMNSDFVTALPTSESYLSSTSGVCVSNNMFPTHIYQNSNTKNLQSSATTLPFQTSLSDSTSLNYMPFSMPDVVTSEPSQNNNNLVDLGSSFQLSRLNDLMEKNFFENKEQTVVLGRMMELQKLMLEGQKLMVGYLAKIVQDLAEAAPAMPSSTMTFAVPSAINTELAAQEVTPMALRNGIDVHPASYMPANGQVTEDGDVSVMYDSGGMDLTTQRHL